MERDAIAAAIKRARDGINQYLEIMDTVHDVDVGRNRDFQRRFNHFYRIRQRSQQWYATYYGLMEASKVTPPTFDDVLEHLRENLGRYEPSFSSKLVATLDPSRPVWDKYVLEHTNQKAPAYSSPRRFERAKTVYRRIEQWYSRFLELSDSRTMIGIFDELVPCHERIIDIKKIDFILWQTRTSHTGAG